MEMKKGFSSRDIVLCEANSTWPIVKLMYIIVSAWNFLITAAIDLWDSIYIWIYSQRTIYRLTEEDRKQLLEWAQSKTPGCFIADFNNSWKDGIYLVALIEALIPSTCYSCSQYQLLNPQNRKQNIELGFSMAKKYLGVKPIMTADEFLKTGDDATERKIIRYVTLLKLASARKKMRTVLAIPRIAGLDEDSMFRGLACFAKGMGLMLAVKNRKAKFNIYLKESRNLDIVIEIRGPNEDFVSERITNRSPRHKRSQARDSSPSVIKTSQHQLKSKINIPLEYEILGKKVSASYIPQSTGVHTLKIYWQGQHIQGSPYSVTVDDSADFLSDMKPKMHHLHPGQYNTSGNINKLSVTSASTSVASKLPKIGRIRTKRIIRTYVIRNGEEIELKDDVPLPKDIHAWASEKGVSFEEDPQETSTVIEQQKKPGPLKRSRTLIRDDSIDVGPKSSDLLMDITEENTLKPEIKIESGQETNEHHPAKTGNVLNLQQTQICFLDSPVGNLEISKTSPKSKSEFNSMLETSLKRNKSGSIENLHRLNSSDQEEIKPINQNLIENDTSDHYFSTNQQRICKEQQTASLLSETLSSNNELYDKLNSASKSNKCSVSNEKSYNNSIEDFRFPGLSDSDQDKKLNSTQKTEPNNGKSESENNYPTISTEVPTATDSNQSTKEITNWIANSMIADQTPLTETSEEFHKLPLSEQLSNDSKSIDFVGTFCNALQSETNRSEDSVDFWKDTSLEETRETELFKSDSEIMNNLSLISIVSEVSNDSCTSNFEVAFEDDKDRGNNINKRNNNVDKNETKCEETEMNFSSPIMETSNSSLVKNKVDEWEKALAQMNESKECKNITQRRKLRNQLPWLEGRRDSSDSPSFETEPHFKERLKWPISPVSTDIHNSAEALESNGRTTKVDIKSLIKQWEIVGKKATKDSRISHSRSDKIRFKIEQKKENWENKLQKERPFLNMVLKDKTTNTKIVPQVKKKSSQQNFKYTSVIKTNNGYSNNANWNITDNLVQSKPFSSKTSLSTIEMPNNCAMLESMLSCYNMHQNPLYSPYDDCDASDDLDSLDPILFDSEENCDQASSSDVTSGFSETRDSENSHNYMSETLGYEYCPFLGLGDKTGLISYNKLLQYDAKIDTPPHKCEETEYNVPKPENCYAFGSGVHYGQVGIKNNFQVQTKGSGDGALTVGVHGPNKASVVEITICYMGHNLYEVLYEVTKPAYYMIAVKWNDINIPNSPFICKITY